MNVLSNKSGKNTASHDVLFDQGLRAEATLDHVIQTELSNTNNKQTPQASVEEELKRQPILDRNTKRTKSRVLFITRDESVLVAKSSVQEKYLALQSLFDEVHIMTLLPRVHSDGYKRIAKNVWTYQVHARYWWQLPKAALYSANEALVFNGAVRPDVIVATDPFESGLAAYYIAKDFGRPVQVHINEDYFKPQFLQLNKQNSWRRRLAHYVLKRVASVRVETEELKKKIQSKYKKITDVAVLPHFYNFTGLLEAEVTSDVRRQYRQFSFIIVAFGPLSADSHLHDTFSALRSVLLNERVGLVVVGEGKAKSLFVEKADILGITKSVVFVDKPKDLVSLLKTANLLVSTDTTKAGDVLVMQAAAAGLPIVGYETELRLDLFKEGESGYFVENDDVLGLSQKVTKLLNAEALRLSFARNGQRIARESLQENPDEYYRSIRDTIEVILVPQATEVPVSKDTKATPTNHEIKENSIAYANS